MNYKDNCAITNIFLYVKNIPAGPSAEPSGLGPLRACAQDPMWVPVLILAAPLAIQLLVA